MHASLAEWWNGISLRTRITGVTVLVMTIGLVVSGFGTMTVLRDYLVGDVDTHITNVADTLKSSSDPVAQGLLATDYVVAQFAPDGTMVRGNRTWQQQHPSITSLSSEQVASRGTDAFTVRDSDG